MSAEFTHNNPSFFYDTLLFKQLLFLEENFSLIREELIQLISSDSEREWLRTFPDYVKAETDKAWKVFSFLFFSMKNPVHRTFCPNTTRLIDQIPDLISCDFSCMEPHTHILPHKGYSRMVLRCHLPLIVPGILGMSTVCVALGASLVSQLLGLCQLLLSQPIQTLS